MQKTHPVQELILSVSGKGHPDWPLLDKVYSPFSSVPCQGFEEWVAERLLAHDTDSLVQFLHLLDGPHSSLGPPEDIRSAEIAEAVLGISRLRLPQHLGQLSDEASALIQACALLEGSRGSLINATSEIDEERAFLTEHERDVALFPALRGGLSRAESYFCILTWSLLTSNTGIYLAEAAIPFEIQFNLPPLLRRMLDFADEYEKKVRPLTDDAEEESASQGRLELFRGVDMLDVVALLPMCGTPARPQPSGAEANELRSCLSTVSVSARRHFFDAVEYTSTAYRTETIPLDEGQHIKLSVGEPGAARPRSVLEMTFYDTRVRGIDVQATSKELERAGLIEYCVQADQVTRSLLKSELMDLLTSRGVYCAKSWNKSRMAALALEHASSKLEEIGRQRLFCVVPERWKLAVEELEELLGYYDVGFRLWLAFGVLPVK